MTEDDRIWTIPNLLTLCRFLLLIPILISLAHGQRILAIGLGVAGIGTDLLDGVIARKWNQFSRLGRILDPAVDKINVLSVTLLMTISSLYRFPKWFFGFILLRETAVLIFGALMIKRGRAVTESMRPGKISAFSIGVAVLVFIMGWQPYGWIMIWIALVLTLYSSWVYVRRFQRLSKFSQ